MNVAGLTSGVIAISAAYHYTCALLGSGGVKCWGLGRGSTPTDVMGLPSGAVAIAAGGHHTCALFDTGGIMCWGGNTYGALGDGTWTDSDIPVNVLGLTAGVSAVAAGMNHTCVLLGTGGLKCWGYNANGQLGDGTYTDRSRPVEVMGLHSGVTAVSLGDSHTCALLGTGEVKCWGSDHYAQASGFFTGFPHSVICM